MNNKRRWVVFVNQIVDYIKNYNFNNQQHNDITYYEVYSVLNKELNFSWRKAFQISPWWFKESLEEARNIFKQLILKLKEREFIIIWIDESSFSSSALPLFMNDEKKRSWSYIRKSSERLNVFASQVEKGSLFYVKKKNQKRRTV